MHHRPTTLLRCAAILGLWSAGWAQQPTPQLVAQLEPGYMVSAAFTADGQRLITVGDEITVWDVASGLVMRRFDGRLVERIAVSADGWFVATAGGGGLIVHEIETGLSRTVSTIPYEGVGQLEFTADGQGVRIATDFAVAHWEIERRTRSFLLGGHLASPESPTVTAWPSMPSAVCLARDGTRALAACTDGTLRLWDIGAPDLLEGSYEETLLTSVGFAASGGTTTMSPDGSLIGLVTDSGRALVWNADGSRVADFSVASDVAGLDEPYFDSSSTVGLLPSGHLVVAGEETRIYDVRSGAAVRTLPARVLAISRDMSMAALAEDLENWPRIVRLADGEVHRQLKGRVSSINEIAISDDGRYLALGDMGKAVHVWDLQIGQIVDNRRFEHPVYALDISEDGRRLAATYGYSEDAVTVVWERGATRDLLEVEGQGFVRFLPGATTIVVGATELSDGVLAVQRYDVSSGNALAAYGADRDDLSFAHLAVSADGQRLVASMPGMYDDEGGLAIVWEVETGVELFRVDRRCGNAFLDATGKHLFLGAFNDSGAEVWNLDARSRLRDLSGNLACSSPDGTLWATAESNGVRLRRANAREVRALLDVHERPVGDLCFSPDGRHLFSGGLDGVVSITHVAQNRVIARLLSLDAGGWAVLDPSGRFDASNGGDARGLHWVVGAEILELSQLKNGYYLPGLLPALLRDDVDELGDVASLVDTAIPLPPAVELPEEIGAQFEVVLTNRGGGIGPVSVRVNGRELAGDARPAGSDPDAEELRFTVDLTRSPQYRPGFANDVEVVPSTARGGLLGRGGRRRVRGARRDNSTTPRLFAVVAGVSDYAGTNIRLKFAAKDAKDFGAAIDRAARRMFGAENVDVTILPAGERKTTGANLRAALEQVAERATGDDTVLLYLAGHGVSDSDEYFFMTQEATELALPPVGSARLRVALSGNELTAWLKTLKALRVVLILDTCDSGQLATGLGNARGGSGSRMRALQRLRDRTAVYVLAGSAADRPSYESNSYGQGLLTYALLSSMRNADVLREQTFVDVQKLFGHVQDLVPRLAQGQGGVQRPQLAMPRGLVADSERSVGSFDIGRLLEEDRLAIPLAQELPLVMRADFENEARQDTLHLSAQTDESLRDYASGSRARFRFADGAVVAGAHRVTGTYSLRDGRVSLRMFVYRPDGELATKEPLEVSGSSTDMSALVKDVLRKVIGAVQP